MKVALVYDRVNKWGGAERVLLALHEIWPQAPLYTSVYDPKKALWAKEFKVIPSFLQRFPWAKSKHELYPLLMPLAFESFDFDQYDVVISVTSEAAKGIITKPGTLHLCYCLTPTRYLWSGYTSYFNSRGLRLISRPLVNYLRKWDLVAAQRVDGYSAISQTVQKRINKYYGRPSEVIYPPIDTEIFNNQNRKIKIEGKFFLVVSRLVKYKNVDLVIKAFNHLGWNLKIVGTGDEENKLIRISKANIEFLGQLTDEKLLSYYQNCAAVIFPQEEDFGIVPLEAQACGRPVIAFGAGGATETVVGKKTGLFFYPQTPEALLKALNSFRPSNYKEEDCQAQTDKFTKERFKKEFKKTVENKWRKYQKNICML